jgi:DNA invertase Pin-like site-specific DNA recombinase
MLIGYARVSTVDQDPALQRDALKRAGCEKIFEETASGAKVDRPQLARALEHMRKGDTLVVWKLDRLARSMKQLIETVGRLEAAGVKFRSITENVGTDSAGGRFVFHIFGALAEFERSLIRERTQAGLNAARARGRKGGRPKAMSADDLAVANSLLAAKREPDEVARRLGVSPRTLYRHLAEAKKTPPQKKIAKASNDLAAFAVAIKRVLKGRSTKPLRKKVAIAEAYEISGRKELDVGTLDAFKKRLAAAAREGLLELERCDVVGVLPATVLKSSRTQFGRDERHLIVTEGL